MAASAWSVFARAKHNIGNGTINLGGNTTFRLTLHTSAASANLASIISTFTSVGNECAATGGYTDQALSTTWTGAASAGDSTRTFDIITDPVITASGAALSNVRFAVVRLSTSAGGGPLLCYAALSTSQFDVGSSNTLTIQINANGVFTLT